MTEWEIEVRVIHNIEALMKGYLNRVASRPEISGNLEKSGNFVALEKVREMSGNFVKFGKVREF